MPVTPTSFDDGFGMWLYVHDDAPGGSHEGQLDPDSVTYGMLADGSLDLNLLLVPCPFEGCDSVSAWPSGGGSNALMGQSMHVLKEYEATSVVSRGAAAMSVADAAEQVKARVVATDGEERWVLDDAVLHALEARDADAQ